MKEINQVGLTQEVEKERTMMKDLVVSFLLQKQADEQATEFECMCSDLLNCIFIIQNMEKEKQSALQSQLKAKVPDEQRLNQLKTLDNKLSNVQKLLQQHQPAK